MKDTNKKIMIIKLQGKLSFGEQTLWLDKGVTAKIKEHLHSLIDLIRKQVNSLLFRIIATWRR